MNLVYYSQEDPRWRNAMYSRDHNPKQTIGLTGCGPTSFAMVYSSLTGKQMLPPEAAKYAVDHGHRTSDSGTAWSLFPAAAKAYGLTCAQSFNLDAVKKALVAGGALVIASMRSGQFTSSGHFIVLTDAHDGLIDVMDPNHDNNNYKSGIVEVGKKNDGFVGAKESVFRSEARSYWIFTYEGEDKPMTAEERKMMDDMREDITAIKTVVEAATRLVAAPDWFVSEFGSANLGGLINDPKLTAEGWRTLAISLRMQGLGTGTKGGAK